MSANQVSDEFSAFIESLRSPDNSVRDAAEAQLDQMREADIFNVITQFFNILQTNISSSQKAFIAVILRKVIDATAWKKLDNGARAQVQGFLLQLFQNEGESRVRRALCDIISQVNTLQEDWDHLYEFIISASSQNNDVCVEGLYLLGEIGYENESMVVENMQQIIQTISNTLQSPVLAYKVAASRCVMKLLTLEVDTVVNTFSSALPAVVETIQIALNNGDEDALLNLLEDLDNCLLTACSYLTNHIRTLVEMGLSICGNATYPCGIRSLAADVIYNIAERNGGFFRKNTRYVESYMKIAVEMMMDMDDDDNWVNGTFGEEDELIENDSVPHVLGCKMVATMATALHAAAYKPIMQLVSHCSRSNDWKVRRCTYTMMSHMSDGCHKQMETDLKLHTTNLMNGFNDPHPRVVFVAVQAFAFLSTSLAGVFQKKSGAQMIQALLNLLQKQPCLRVQAVIASALGQFCNCEMISKKIFKNMLAPIVEWLTGLCGAPMPSVQSEAISAIGFLCRATKDDFAPFFHGIVQGLINILSGPVSPENINVHVSASACLSSLVSSMGKAASQKEAWEIMQFMLGLIEKTAMGDERLTCLLDCAAEIFQYCTEEQKQQFLTIMIPYLLQMAKTDVGFSIRQVVSGPEYQMENGVERTTVDAHGMGKVQLSLNTTAIECVSNAVRLIHNLIIDANKMMLPYVSEIKEMVFALCHFDFHEEVRILCSRIMPQMLELLVDSLKENQVSVELVMDLFNQIIPTLFEQYGEEDNASERMAIAEAIRTSLQMIYQSGDEDHHLFVNQRVPVNMDTIGSIVEMLAANITEGVDILQTAYEAVDFNDREMEDARNEFEEEVGDEKSCVENLLDAVSYCIRLAGANMEPLFQKYVKPMCEKYMQSNFEYIKFVGVCMMDDMLQYATHCMGNYVNDMMNVYSQHMQCEDPALRQCVLYGIKIVVEKYPTAISQQARQILASLMAVISSPEAMEDDYRCSTDNAVSAVFSILINFGKGLPPKEFHSGMSFVIEYLPMAEDIDEAQDVHERFVNELMKPNHGILNHPNFVEGAMHVLPLLLLPTFDDGDNEYEVVYPETKQIIVNLLKSMSPNDINRLIHNQEPEVKEAIMQQLM